MRLFIAALLVAISYAQTGISSSVAMAALITTQMCFVCAEGKFGDERRNLGRKSAIRRSLLSSEVTRAFQRLMH